MLRLRLFRDVGDLIFPRLCTACNYPLLAHEHTICLKCRIALPRTDYGLYADNPVAKKFWGKVPVEEAVAMLHFHKGSRVQSMMHALKYKGRQDVGIVLGQMLGYYMHQHQIFRQQEIITAVPLHPVKIKLRVITKVRALAKG